MCGRGPLVTDLQIVVVFPVDNAFVLEPASKTPAAGLVDLERELDALLLEYESLSRAWPKEPRILIDDNRIHVRGELVCPLSPNFHAFDPALFWCR